jgi:hypothetical protein
MALITKASFIIETIWAIINALKLWVFRKIKFYDFPLNILKIFFILFFKIIYFYLIEVKDFILYTC